MANVAIDSDTAVINAVNFTQQGSDPTTPAASHWKLYFLSSGLWYISSGGTKTQLVTSVGLSMPAEFSVASSPVTSSGTIAVTKANQSANQIYAGPTTGAAAAPAFRVLVPADYPVFVASGATHAAGAVPDPGSVAGSTKFLREDATWATPAGSGTVTSVGLALPTEFSVTGSPVTGSGTLTGAWANESANQVFAGPSSGGATTPAFRALATADLPTSSKTVTINFILNGGGSALTTGVQPSVEIAFAGTITAARMHTDGSSGSVTVDVLKAAYNGAFSSIVGAGTKPNISNAATSQWYQDTTLTSWTTSISAGDWIQFNITAAATLTSATISLTVTKA